jgi:hypothetical protein
MSSKKSLENLRGTDGKFSSFYDICCKLVAYLAVLKPILVLTRFIFELFMEEKFYFEDF